jgi:hypothetical protein
MSPFPFCQNNFVVKIFSAICIKEKFLDNLPHSGRQCWGVSENPDKILEHVKENSKHVQAQ